MVTQIQPELIPATDRNWKKEDALAPVTPLSLMQIALERGQVEQLQILQDMHFKQLAREAEIEFNEAMNKAQMELGRIAPDLTNPSTKSKYASYAALDNKIRPIYTRLGLSLSFSEEDSPKPDHARIICYVSRGSYTRIYRKDMPVDGRGPQGSAVMSKTHATASADSYGRRYLLKDIFNIAIGEDDNDGNGAEPEMPGIDDWLTVIRDSSTFDELDRQFRAAYTQASKADNERAQKILIAAKDERRGQLRKAGAK